MSARNVGNHFETSFMNLAMMSHVVMERAAEDARERRAILVHNARIAAIRAARRRRNVAAAAEHQAVVAKGQSRMSLWLDANDIH